MYRVIQEALTNVRKHAPGSMASVAIAYGLSDITIRVENDGSTVRSAGSPTGYGHGLIGMRERVALYDGSLTAEPRPDGGFAVTIRLPLRRLEAAQP